MKSPKSYPTTASEFLNALTMKGIENNIVDDLTHGESSHFPAEHHLSHCHLLPGDQVKQHTLERHWCAKYSGEVD